MEEHSLGNRRSPNRKNTLCTQRILIKDRVLHGQVYFSLSFFPFFFFLSRRRRLRLHIYLQSKLGRRASVRERRHSPLTAAPLPVKGQVHNTQFTPD